jgi:hypothetical protein
MPIGLYTYVDNTRHEDVVDLVTNVDYRSTPFVSNIGESVATNTYHEWLTDTFAAAAANVGIEGADVTIVDLAAPSRQGNVVQMFQKVIAVSDTELAIPHYGQNNPFEYQTNKKLVEVARDMELAAIKGTVASGNSGVGRTMAGAIALITSNKTAQTSGTSFTEDVFNSLMALVYSSGTDEDIDIVFTGAYLKRVIDKFATNTTKYLDAEEFKQVLRVDVYQSSFGQHQIAMERNIPAGAVLGIDTSKWRLAWLTGRRLAIKPLAKTGSATKALLEGEATLEALNEKSSFYASGYFFA